MSETKKFMVTIIETLKHTVEIEAINPKDAEQLAYDKWKNSEYILSAENFVDVTFEIVPLIE